MKPIRAKRAVNNGKQAWLVDLRAFGQGRKFFQEEQEAKLEAASWEKERRLHGAAAFALDTSERSQFIAARDRLAEVGASINDAVDFFMRHGPKRQPTTLSDALNAIIANRRQAGKRPRSVAQLECGLGIFIKGREELLVSDVTQEMVEQWLHGGGWSMLTRKGKLREVRTLFNFCIEKGWCGVNPCPPLRTITVEDKPPGILTVPEVARLLRVAREQFPELLVYFAVGVFAGIRPEEMQKMTWEQHINLGGRYIEVPAVIAKTRKRRLVEMSPNLRAWLEAAEAKQFRCKWFKGRLAKARDAAQVGWSNDCMRHSFASYHLARWGSADKTATQLGHASTRMLFAHYRELVTRQQARKFWAIRP